MQRSFQSQNVMQWLSCPILRSCWLEGEKLHLETKLWKSWSILFLSKSSQLLGLRGVYSTVAERDRGVRECQMVSNQRIHDKAKSKKTQTGNLHFDVRANKWLHDVRQQKTQWRGEHSLSAEDTLWKGQEDLNYSKRNKEIRPDGV